jgi:predicted RNA-binding protein with PIN domain
MQYLIDGHNLIPFIPGMSLADFDDEDRLVSLLQLHGRVSRSRIEVFFDKAPIGQPRTRRVGMVTVHSIASPAIADTAIIERVKSIKNPRSWNVVSHDRMVQDSCRRLGAIIVDSPDFARSILESQRKDGQKAREQPMLETGELDEWLKLFGAEKPGGGSQD